MFLWFILTIYFNLLKQFFLKIHVVKHYLSGYDEKKKTYLAWNNYALLVYFQIDYFWIMCWNSFHHCSLWSHQELPISVNQVCTAMEDTTHIWSTCFWNRQNLFVIYDGVNSDRFYICVKRNIRNSLVIYFRLLWRVNIWNNYFICNFC